MRTCINTVHPIVVEAAFIKYKEENKYKEVKW